MGGDRQCAAHGSRREGGLTPALANADSRAIISEKLFNANSLQKSRIVLSMISLLDERRCQGARRKAAAIASHEQTEGKHQKAGVVRYSRHEGLAPVRLSIGLDAGSSL